MAYAQRAGRLESRSSRQFLKKRDSCFCQVCHESRDFCSLEYQQYVNGSGGDEWF